MATKRTKSEKAEREEESVAADTGNAESFAEQKAARVEARRQARRDAIAGIPQSVIYGDDDDEKAPDKPTS